MDLHQLRCFQIVVEEGGFKRATTRLHITQPALSYQIKQLETELGTQLFLRRPGGIILTEAGRVLFDRVPPVMEAVRRAERAVGDLAQGVAGEVRIGTVNSVGTYLLPSLLREFRRQFPATRTKILYRESNAIIEALLADRVDLAIVVNPVPDRRLRRETLIREPVALVCSRAHALAGKSVLAPEELKGLDFVTLSPESPTGALIRDHLARMGVSVEPVVTTHNVETVKKMVAVGLGVAFLPAMVTSGEPATRGRPRGTLWHAQVEPPLFRRIELVTWRKGPANKATAAFVQGLRRYSADWRSALEKPED